VKNRDTLTMTITATIAGAVGMLANFALFFGGNRNNPLGIVGALLVMFLAPMAAGLVQMAISRSREYEADRIGAEICGNPLSLASALEKLEQGSKRVMNQAAEDNPATAHMFIVNPLNGQKMDNLFSTHPNMKNRIQRLNALARDMMTNPSRPRQSASQSNVDWSRYGSSDRYASDSKPKRKGSSGIPSSGGKDADKGSKGPWG